MDIRPEYREKSIRSYVVRAGRMTEAQRKAFEVSWPAYGLKLADGAIDTDEVFGRSGLKVLEIGFGMGDSLLQMAAAEPDTDFIGIEVHPPGVGTIINSARAEGLANLRVYLADANDVLKNVLCLRVLIVCNSTSQTLGIRKNTIKDVLCSLHLFSRSEQSYALMVYYTWRRTGSITLSKC